MRTVFNKIYGIFAIVVFVYASVVFAAPVNKNLPAQGAGKKVTIPCKPQPPIESLQPKEKQQEARQLKLDKQKASGITPSSPPAPCIVQLNQNQLSQSKVVAGGKTCAYVPTPSDHCPAVIRYAKAGKGEVTECGMDVNPSCSGGGGGNGGGSGEQQGQQPPMDNQPPGSQGGQGGQEQGGQGGGAPQMPQIPEKQQQPKQPEREKSPEEKEWERQKRIAELKKKLADQARKDNPNAERLAPKENTDTPTESKSWLRRGWESIFGKPEPQTNTQSISQRIGDDGTYDDVFIDDVPTYMYGDLIGSQGNPDYYLNGSPSSYNTTQDQDSGFFSRAMSAVRNIYNNTVDFFFGE